MATIVWEIDGVIEGTSFSDGFTYNDSGNEGININDFCSELWQAVNNNMDEFNFETQTWMEIAVSAYVSGDFTIQSPGVKLSIRKVEN